MSMIEELLDHPVQDVLQPLADVYREWELKVDDPRFCHVQSQLKIEKVRKVQAFVLLLLLKGSSVLLLARTGWGKSLIFQGLRYAALKESDGPQESRHITVIFVPLSGLGQEQADEINEKAGSDVAIFYDKTKVDDRHLLDIRNGRYSWVLRMGTLASMSEELRLAFAEGQKLLRQQHMENQAALVAVSFSFLSSCLVFSCIAPSI